METVLVTGRAGFIGNHINYIYDHLPDKGDSIIYIDNFDDCYNPK